MKTQPYYASPSTFSDKYYSKIAPALLEWREPREVADYEWEHVGAAKWKKQLFTLWKWLAIVGVPMLYGEWRWSPASFSSALIQFLSYAILFPIMFRLQKGKTDVQCVIDENGIKKITGGLTSRPDKKVTGGLIARYYWKNIESYRFADYPHIPGIRELILTVREGKESSECNFHFDPQQVDESVIADLLHQYLPQLPENALD